MRSRGLIGAALIVLAANVWALVGVARNRSGEAEAEVILTERELPLTSHGSADVAARSLRLTWQRLDALDDPGAPPWLDERKLGEIGFDASVPLASASAVEFYRRQVAREAYVVLEYDGPAWAARIDRRRREVEDVRSKAARGEATSGDLAAAEKRLADDGTTASRLIPIDAGPDAGELRRRHADRRREIVVPALVGIATWPRRPAGQERREGPGGPAASGKNPPAPVARGVILQLLVEEIAVPPDRRPPLDALPAPTGELPSPRYDVRVRFGRRLEPWIAEIRSIR